MSFKFRRRGDVSEQSPQQEPFFQNAAGQQSFDATMYPQMGQPQGYDPNFNAGYPPQHSYFQQPQSSLGPQVHGNQQSAQPFFQNHEESFYTPQQIQAMQSMAQRHPQQPMLNHAPNQPYGMPNPQMPQPQGPSAYMHPVQASQLGNFQGYPSAPQGFQASHLGYAPEDVRSLNFWRETQANSGFEGLETDQESNSPIRLLVAVAGVALIAGLSWFAYKWAKSPSSDIPPLIHTEPGPHKVHPDHRGGINIPYQDKLIYDRISDGNNAEPAERLLPPPEAPIANTQPQPMEQNQQQNQQMAQQPMYNAPGNAMQNGQVQGGLQQQQMMEPQSPPQQVPMNMQSQQQIVAPTVTTTEAKIQIQEEPEVVRKPESTLKGNYFVQMATVKSEASALKEWKRLQAKYNLKGMKSQIKESETTDGEIVYRLLMGPFEEKVKAMKHAVKMDGAKVIQITE